MKWDLNSYKPVGCMVALALLVGQCVIGDSGKYSSVTALERLRFVAGNAFSVANPGYRILFGKEFEIRREGSHGVLPVEISPQWSDVGDDGVWPMGPFELRQNIFTGKIESPALPASRASRVTETMRRSDETIKEARKRAAKLLSELRGGVDLGALVEFQEPVLSSISSDEDIGMRRVILSFDGTRRPIYWELGTCESKGLPSSCEELSAVGQFQQWVSLLRPGDENLLRNFDLNLRDLQLAAREAKVFAAIEIGISAKQLKSFFGDSNVRMVYVTSASLRCAPGDSIECRYRPFPK